MKINQMQKSKAVHSELGIATELASITCILADSKEGREV